MNTGQDGSVDERRRDDDKTGVHGKGLAGAFRSV